jgi:hypothetical protein
VNVPGLCRQVADISGTDLAGLSAALAPEEDALEQVYEQLVAAVREMAVSMPEISSVQGLSSMPVLVEDAAEAVASFYMEEGGGAGLEDR